MSDVFISYTHKDHEDAKRLGDALRRRGFSVFWDRNILAGHTYDEVIDRELNDAECVLVLWTKESVKSKWVRDEATRAAKRQALVPVLMETVEQPLGFGMTQAVNLRGWKGEEGSTAFRSLVEAISSRAAKPPTTVPLPGRSLRGWIAAGSLAAVAIAVIVIGVYIPAKAKAECSRLYLTAIDQYNNAVITSQAEAARKLFEQVNSKCGSELAGMWLARCYYKGLMGCEPDQQKGQELAHQFVSRVRDKVARSHDPSATFLLSSAYGEGLGVVKDRQLAAQLLRTAAQAGFLLAQFDLGTKLLNGDLAPEHGREGEEWLETAARGGLSEASFQLAVRHFEGKNIDQSHIWFQKAAEQGHPLAKVQLGDMVRDAVPCKACELYEQAAALGSVPAQVRLGWCYYKGLSCTGKGGAATFLHDGCMAENLFKAAAEKSDKDALFNLGLARERGYCGRPNIAEATRYLTRAASAGSEAAKLELIRLADSNENKSGKHR